MRSTLAAAAWLLAACGSDLVDRDRDGIAEDVDCDDADPDSTSTVADHDCDGVPGFEDDCDDDDPTVGAQAGDQDCDGLLTADDCDDADPLSSPRDNDADCDGTLTGADCDDSDPASTSHPADGDCDDTLTADDCDDGDPTSTIIADDGDCDDTLTADDCDDGDPTSTIVAEDGDCDDTLTADDCDDGDPTSTIVAEDGDCDGFRTTVDCDDDAAAVGSVATRVADLFAGDFVVVVDAWADYATGDDVPFELDPDPRAFRIRSSNNAFIANPDSSWMLVTVTADDGTVTVASNECFDYGPGFCLNVAGVGTVSCAGDVDLVNSMGNFTNNAFQLDKILPPPP